MTIEAGAVVVLKSGGMAMTVVDADEEKAECVWCGEEGEIFRKTIPTIALMIAIEKEEDGKDNGRDEEHDEDGEDDDDHRSSSKKKKKAA